MAVCEECKKLRRLLAKADLRIDALLKARDTLSAMHAEASAELADRDLRDGNVREAVRELMRLLDTEAA
jgi:hypothetical protein